MPEAPRTDHDAAVAGPEPPGRLGRRVVRREARVGESGDVRRFDGVVEPYDTVR
ncbi:hypothetical protein [Streptomyces olivaceus]|uniref:hypothetical protein n=1 Tax=Streptomyces olivaceus TaxID=47716 RepID=UPI0033A1107B